MERHGFWAGLVYDTLERHFLPLAARRGWRPDQVTWTGLWLSAATGIAFFFSPAAGGLLLILAGLCDVADGLLAREQKRKSAAGAFLDSTLDRYAEIFVFTGLWGHLYHHGMDAQSATLLVIAALGGSLMVSYARARGEGLGVKHTAGFFQRTQRVVTVIVAALAEALFGWPILALAVGVLAVGTNLTALYRIFSIRNLLAEQDASLPPQKDNAGNEEDGGAPADAEQTADRLP